MLNTILTLRLNQSMTDDDMFLVYKMIRSKLNRMIIIEMNFDNKSVSFKYCGAERNSSTSFDEITPNLKECEVEELTSWIEKLLMH